MWSELVVNLLEATIISKMEQLDLPRELYQKTSNLNIFERSVLYKSIIDNHNDFDFVLGLSAGLGNGNRVEMDGTMQDQCYSQSLFEQRKTTTTAR
jgi:hypothetical protein